MKSHNSHESDKNEIELSLPSKHEMNQPFKMMFFYEVTMVLMVAFVIALGIFNQIPKLNNDYFSIIAKMTLPASLLGAIAGMVVIWYFRGSKELRMDITAENAKMTSVTFFRVFICLFSIHTVVSIGSIVIETIISSFGYTIPEIYITIDLVSIIYICFIGPIIEEIVYRGVLLGIFKQYGKIFAIVVTAILFCLGHGNISQCLSAGLAGLVLGYVALEYSLKWSILFHIINNFVFSIGKGSLYLLTNYYIADLIMSIFLGIFFLLSLIMLWKNRLKIRAYIDQNKSPRQLYTFAFTRIWALINIALGLVRISSSISKQ